VDACPAFFCGILSREKKRMKNQYSETHCHAFLHLDQAKQVSFNDTGRIMPAFYIAIKKA